MRHRGRGIDLQRHLERRETSDRAFHAREQIGARASALIGWSGMRGVVTVAAAQALPAETPYRSVLVLAAFTVAVGTLLLGGLSLPAFARVLGLREQAASVPTEVRGLFVELTEAGQQALAYPDLARADGNRFSEAAIQRVAAEVREQAALATRGAPFTATGDQHDEILELRRIVFRAEREALADARATSSYGSAALATAETILNTLEEGRGTD